MNQTSLNQNIWIKRTIVGLMLFALIFGLVNVFIMPPFMNPDEIQHFVFSASHAYSKDRLKTLDHEVLQVLKDYRWFHFIGVGPGWQTRFKEIKEIYFIQYFNREKHSLSKTYFHFLYGKALKLSGIKNPIVALYFMRLLSFFIFLAISALSIFFYKKYFPDYWFYMAAGQLLLFQPATILNSINYDVLLTLLGALFFVFAYRIKSEEKVNLAFLVILAGLASLIKIGGLLFFFYLFLLMLFKYKSVHAFFKKLPLAILGIVIVFSWFNYWFPDRFFTLYTALFAKLRGVINLLSDVKGDFLSLHFFDSMIDSFYFHTGWMGFKIGALWYVIQKVFLLIALIGSALLIFSKKMRTLSHEKQWTVYVLMVIVLQMLSIRFYYGSGSMAQGRYLFPLLLPIITLIFSGLKAIEKYFNFKNSYIAISMLLFQVVFLLIALSRVISVFYFEIASPHIGL